MIVVYIKNYALYSELMMLVNLECGPNSIIIKYLAKGHTWMTEDKNPSPLFAALL